MKLSNKNFKAHANFIPSQHSYMRVLNKGGLTYTDSGFKSDTFNIIHIHDENVILDDIKEGIDFIENRLRSACIWLEEGHLTPQLKTNLDSLSYQNTDSSEMLSFELPADKEFDVHPNINRVKEKQEIIDHAFVIANNWEPFDVEVLHYYNRSAEVILNQNKSLLYNYFDGEAVIGVIELFIDPEDETVAGIYNLSVLKEHRNKGIGMLLIQHVLYTAKILGVKKIVTQASDESMKLFGRIGFEEMGKIMEFGKK
ncbi:GNAT family N-acetyltransferase [Flammeovirga pacifica]|uniref:N-acetyltransferase domain-containing protein n=1 Tax=Flammeovirga pacifica TaxID=915059 RepID=A0A1S1YSP0_FLAPC|nr:GNAT family N-acetyltransferase [Flammeovirga pacifica]OHX64028.1 hypothetical protein NH26_20685 [Flammeovirga pacifica]